MDISDARALTMAGRRISKEDVQRLESTIDINPDDVTARIKLIGYYFSQHTTNKVIRKSACRHIFWFVTNDPSHLILSQPEASPHFDTISDDLYLTGEKLWNEQVLEHSNTAAILINAACFFYFRDWDRAISLLEAALELEPASDPIKDKLAFTYELGAKTEKGDERLERAMKLREELVTVSGRTLDKLINLADTAYRLEDFEKCRINAERVLKSSAPYDDYGDEFHSAHQLIGLLKLRENNKSDACQSLLRSTQIKPTPVLGSFGPRFELAKELLAQGERSTVSKYLRDCSTFWKSGQTCLTFWWIQIQLGQTTNLNKQGDVELLTPRWLNPSASLLMKVVRASAKD